MRRRHTDSANNQKVAKEVRRLCREGKEEAGPPVMMQTWRYYVLFWGVIALMYWTMV